MSDCSFTIRSNSEMLTELLVKAKFDIPVNRMEVIPENLAWLGRNLAIRNKTKPDFLLAVHLLKGAMSDFNLTGMVLI